MFPVLQAVEVKSGLRQTDISTLPSQQMILQTKEQSGGSDDFSESSKGHLE